MSNGIGADELRAFIERIERMEEEKKAAALDIREIYAEAKGRGFDTKAIRQIVKMRGQDAQERAEQEAILEIYMMALGMLGPAEDDADPTTPAEEKPAPIRKRKADYNPIGFETDGTV